MGSEVGDTVPASQTATLTGSYLAEHIGQTVYPVWQDPPKYLCRKCNKTFDFPEYRMYKPNMTLQLARAHCPHCHRKWEQ